MVIESSSAAAFAGEMRRRVRTNLNPPGLRLLALLAEDLRVHRYDPLSQGFWAVGVHRIGNSAKSIRPILAMKLAFNLYRLINRLVEWFTGISIVHTTIVGRRLRIWHHSGIIVNADRIGDDVTIRQNTTVGESGVGEGLPVIGDRVDIGCGAVIIGKIEIGSGARIGANAVVITNVLSDDVVGGIPARTLVRRVQNENEN